MNDYHWTSSARSHAGRVRDVNEDACLEQPERGLWAVADGMGGHSLGEFASRLVVRALTDLPVAGDLEARIGQVQARLLDANARLRAEAARRDVPIIGTTVAVLIAVQGQCAGLWAGDSRIYLQRAGRLSLLTRDHSPLEDARMRRTGRDADTLDRPASNFITRAVGAADALLLDRFTVDVADGDVFLLCSDGLSNEASALDIGQALTPGHCRQACDALVDLALERGGHDNITAVAARAEDPGSPDRTVPLPTM